MGIIIAKFKKQKTTLELLEKLENEIQSLEDFRRSTEQTQKKMVARFIVISVLVYTILALILYFYFFPVSAYERAMYIIPLIILPVLLIFIKKILSWYYYRKITKNQKKLSNLKDEKKKILDDVMDKETYKVAKTILEKFAPEQIKKNVMPSESSIALNKALTPFGALTPQNSALRYRGPPTLNARTRLSFGPATPKPSQPMLAVTPAFSQKPQIMQSMSKSVIPVSDTPLVLPRPMLQKDRTVLDKMVDYLVGDGPSNRYALICKNCFSHNGMALKEEFEYLSFYCAYCRQLNPAHKKRPVAPKLELPTKFKEKSDVSDSDHSLQSDSEGEVPIAKSKSVENIQHEEQKVLTATESPVESEGKLSDYEMKSSDTESSAMDVDVILTPSEEQSFEKTDIVASSQEERKD